MTSTPDQPTKNPLEWTVFAISGVLVAATFALLAMAALQVKEGPPRLHAETGPPVMLSGWVRIPVTVTNSGDRVAANVQVQVRAGSGSNEREGGFTLDFVPRGASRTGSVSFKSSEVPPGIECEVLGCEEP